MIVSINATIQDETVKIQKYIQKLTPSGELPHERLMLQKFNEEREEVEEAPSGIEKTVHGVCHGQMKTLPTLGSLF